MRRIVIFRIFFALIVFTSQAYAAWQLPEGMTWKTQSGQCKADEGDVFYCAYGPREAENRIAVAYFRVCGDVLESKPFLTVDLVRRNFVFDIGDGTPTQTSPFTRAQHIVIEVARFYSQVQEKRGPCAKERLI